MHAMFTMHVVCHLTLHRHALVLAEEDGLGV